GFTPEEVIEASFRILDQVPAITTSVEAFRARQLTGAESREFATAALHLCYEDAQRHPSAQRRGINILPKFFVRVHADIHAGDQEQRTERSALARESSARSKRKQFGSSFRASAR